MVQMLLSLRTKLVYGPDNFVCHGGVSGILAALQGELAQKSFRLAYIEGPGRFGKSHLAVKLAADAERAGVKSALIDGSAEISWDEVAGEIGSPDSRFALVVDDADLVLSRYAHSDSGSFVSLVERLRVAAAKCVLFGKLPIQSLPGDEHVLSRLRSALGLKITPPAPDELGNVLETMGKQRGLQLSPRRIAFLTKRLRRDIPAIEEYLDKLKFRLDQSGRKGETRVLG